MNFLQDILMKRRMMRQLLWIFALTRGYRWKMVGYISLDIPTLLLGLAFVYESKPCGGYSHRFGGGLVAADHSADSIIRSPGHIDGAMVGLDKRTDESADDGCIAGHVGRFADAGSMGKHKAMAYGRFTVPLEHGCGGSRPDDCHHFSVSFS